MYSPKEEKLKMHTPEFLFNVFLTQVIVLIRSIIPIALFVLVIWYIRQKSIFQEQMLNKLDRLISLLENKQNRE